MSIKSLIKTNLKNIPGKSFKRKYVVIECDDWGGIRMPSAKVLNNIINEGIGNESDRFNFDTLATKEDLESLFEVLSSVKGGNGHSAVMTPITNVTNPDFEKIKQAEFKEYHYEKFTDTLQKYGRGEKVFDLWKQGIKDGIFVPELHGREHLTVQLWLQMLREGNKDLLFAFENEYTSVEVDNINPIANGFRAEFHFDNEDQLPFLKNSIKDAADIFEEIFGYRSRVFVPSNGVFHPVLENDVTNAGVRFLYVNRSMVYQNLNGSVTQRKYITGQKGENGLTYYTRNCAFEPSDERYKGIDFTLMQIAAAFRWGKPAIISTHRANFVGGIDIKNRMKGLNELKMLLKSIVKRWPDVEFISSADALTNYIEH